MPRPRKKEANKCIVSLCVREATTKGMCSTCYSRWYYHHARNHGPQYWEGYDDDTRMRDACSKAFNRTAKRRGLRSVK